MAKKKQGQAIHKRANYIKQSCVEIMRTKHPHEYNAILDEAIKLIPYGAQPRYAETPESESTTAEV